MATPKYYESWSARIATGFLTVLLLCTCTAGNPVEGPDPDGEDSEPPTIGDGQPTGTLPAGTTQITMSVTTDEASTCKWGTSSTTSYADLPNTFTVTGGTTHSTTLTGLADGESYTRYVRCRDAADNANDSSYSVSFSVATAGTGTITGITFDGTTYEQAAAGSDNWPMTWCEDGHQYTSWGDGDGFQVTPPDDERHGFARIEGDWHDSFTGTDLAEYDRHTDPLGGKVESMICLNGNLYALWSPGSDVNGWRFKQMWKSTNKGVTWTQPFARILENPGVGDAAFPIMIVYGQNQAGHDGYVYFLTIRMQDANSWEVQAPGEMYLARGLIAGDAFATQDNWEWLTGIDAQTNTPTWTPDGSGGYAARISVLDDPRGFMRSSAIYLPQFNRFVLTTNHTARNVGNLSMWEAPTPWGPWTRFYNRNAGDSFDTTLGSFAFGSFSPKWLTPDGDCVFVWFRPDTWNSVDCRFMSQSP